MDHNITDGFTHEKMWIWENPKRLLFMETDKTRENLTKILIQSSE